MTGLEVFYAALAEKLEHLARMEANLHYTHGRVLSWWRDDRPFSEWSEEQQEILSAFKVRFSELQDHLASAMKLIAQVEGEDTRRFTYVVNYMEQLGILPDMNAWFQARELRNKATHDYSSPDQDKRRHFGDLLACVEGLYQANQAIKSFVEQHYLKRKS